MLFPEGVAIGGRTGEVSPSTGRYEKRVVERAGKPEIAPNPNQAT
jgi:hypothetical protein